MFHNLCSWFNLLSTIPSEFWQLQLLFFLWNVWTLYLDVARRQVCGILALSKMTARGRDTNHEMASPISEPEPGLRVMTIPPTKCIHFSSVDWAVLRTLTYVILKTSELYVIGCITQRSVLSEAGELISPGRITDKWPSQAQNWVQNLILGIFLLWGPGMFLLVAVDGSAKTRWTVNEHYSVP